MQPAPYLYQHVRGPSQKPNAETRSEESSRAWADTHDVKA
jgi:hypothetical protein